MLYASQSASSRATPPSLEELRDRSIYHSVILSVSSWITHNRGNGRRPNIGMAWARGDPLIVINFWCLSGAGCGSAIILSTSINSLEFRANYSATSNNIKFVRRPLMGMFNGLLHLVRPTDQRPVYQSPYCCIMVRCSAVLMCP